MSVCVCVCVLVCVCVWVCVSTCVCVLVCVCSCECVCQSGCLSCPGIPSIWSDVQEVKLDVKAKKPLWTLADTLSDETPFRSRQSLSPILLFSQTKKNKTSLSRRPNSNNFRRFLFSTISSRPAWAQRSILKANCGFVIREEEASL